MSENIHPALEGMALPISSLLEDPDQVRIHTDEQRQMMAEALEEFGQVYPIAVVPYETAAGDEFTGYVIKAGHLRVAAARALGWDLIAAVVFDDWDEEKTRRFAILDNRIPELSSFDAVKLETLIGDANPVEYGFSSKELDRIVREATTEKPEGIAPEIEFSEVLGEANNYVVLVFENEVDWLQAQTVLGIKSVKCKKLSGGEVRDWSVGVGRVLKGPAVISRISA